MGNSLKIFSICHIRGTFNVNLSRAHYDMNSTDRDKMILACGAQDA